jgi:hypothetical protein
MSLSVFSHSITRKEQNPTLSQHSPQTGFTMLLLKPMNYTLIRSYLSKEIRVPGVLPAIRKFRETGP